VLISLTSKERFWKFKFQSRSKEDVTVHHVIADDRPPSLKHHVTATILPEFEDRCSPFRLPKYE